MALAQILKLLSKLYSLTKLKIVIILSNHRCMLNAFQLNMCHSSTTKPCSKLSNKLMKTSRSMKEGCLFVLFICHIETSQTMVPFVTLFVPLESSWWICVHQVGFVKLVSYCFDLQWRSYWILNNLFMNNSFKSKLKFTREFGPTLDIVRHSISKT